ncbi:MAG: glycosyl transferase family 1 [Candidatus Pelagibacter sp.]|nr:glycosyl transferase family 1 [Candidatus Pelagibacter sp.]OUW23412.1 MAG: glycosyl transferase family 1 [Rickettsiales bacterium TMED174]
MASKIKVLQVIPKLGFGGAETGCYDLAHYLPENDCKSYIVTSGGQLLKYVKKDKVSIIRLPVHSKNPILMIMNSFLLFFIILFLNIDIVHARSRAPAWSCYVSCLLTGRKFITTFHGTYNFKSNFKKFYNSIMLRSKLTIAGSNFIFNHINENYSKYLNPKNKLMVIFRGINLDYFNPKNISEFKRNKLISEWKIEEDKFTILFPGRLTSWKGHDRFIEALNILIQDHHKTNFQAVILGSSQGRNVYQKKIKDLILRYNLNKKIIFIEHCNNMPTAYSLGDVIVSCSVRPEAFGRVSVEAQAMKKPIIASNLGGSKETILNEKSGFLYKFDDPRELGSILNDLMDKDKETLNLIGNEGRKNIIRKFDVENMCKSTFNAYKKILNI